LYENVINVVEVFHFKLDPGILYMPDSLGFLFSSGVVSCSYFPALFLFSCHEVMLSRGPHEIYLSFAPVNAGHVMEIACTN
jgi:hypothetical protein